MDFTDQNLQGMIIKAVVKDLKTNQEYQLEPKPDYKRNGKISRCLFFGPITLPINGRIFSLQFRLDFSDEKINTIRKDPILDLEIYDRSNRKNPKIPVKKYTDIHNTDKSYKDGLWVYDLKDRTIILDDNELHINFSFLLKVTKQFTISAKARIKK